MKKTSQQADEKEDGADLSRTKRIGYSSFQRQLSGPNNRRSSVRNIRETFENAAKNDEVKSGDSVKFHRSDSVKSSSGDKESDTSSVNVSVNGVTKKPSVVKVSKIPVVSDRLHRSSVGDDSGEGDTSVKEGKFSEINTDSVVTKEKPESPVVLRSEIGRETNNNNQVHPEKAQDRLAKSQSLIEQLQQNLATQISTATVEAFKHDYSPALEKSILERSNIHTPSSSRKAPGAISSSKIDNNSNIEEKNIRQPSEQKETEKGDISLSLKRRKLQFFNGIFGPSAPKSVNKPAVKRKDSGDVISPEEGQENKGNRQANGIVHSVVDSVGPLENKKEKEGQDTSDAVKGKSYSAGTNGIETTGELKPNEVRTRETVQTKVSLKGDETIGGVKSRASDKNSCDNSIVKQDNPKPERDKHIDEGLPIGEPVLPSKPARVSWTTRLIQKLTEEETRKKNKPQIKVQKPKRLVRFPQRKEPKPDKPDKPKLNEVKKKPSEVSREIVRPVQVPINYSETDSGATQQEEVKIENVSGVILDDNNKDGYASLITQLVDTPLGGQSDFEEVSEVDSEAKLLKQKKLEEIRAALAREECGTSSSDDESVIALNTSFASSDSTTAITASTGSKELLGEAGKGRKENKPSGIRRLLPQGLFSSNQKNRPLDRRDEDAVLEPLLKTNKSVIGRGDYSRVYPTTSPKPVLETAFLSDSQSKVPNDPRFRQHQRSQSTSPASRHKQTSPKIRRHHLDSPYVDQTSIQENEQNTSRINSQNRSKSLSPSRDRRSSATSPNAKRTIPDTSLILEERLQNIRRELSSPPPGGGVGGVRRPSSTTPADRPNRVQQRQHSLPSSPAGRRPSNKLLQQDQIYQNAVKGYTSNGAPPIPSDAYYHSPPSRRKQQNKIAQNSPNDHRLEDYHRKVSGGSSASSTSTIVADSPSNSSSWNPLLLNLEHQAISGSPDIRKLQQQRHHRTADDTGIYGEIRNGSYSDSPGYRENAMLNRRHLASPRTDSPDVYYHQNSGIVDKPQGLLQVHYNPPLGQQRSPSSVPSGRLSAPPVPSHNVEDYPRRRVISPEPHRSRQEYPPQPNKRSTSQPPISRQPYRDTGPHHPSFQPIIPTEKRVVLPVGAQVKITAPPQPQQRQDHPINKETQTARSYVQQQQYRHLATAPDGPKESPQNLSPSERPQNVSPQKTPPEQGQRQYKKLSRQEIEALYWETQKFREGLSSLSKQFSPNVPRLGERYPSTSSLPPQLSPAQMNAMRPQQNSPMLSPHYQTDGVPRQPYRTQSAINVGSGYGSLIVKPQPIYNNVQHYQNYQMIQQARGQQENPLPSPAAMRVPRARSVSPGPNSNRHLSSRSLSLPRSISGNILIENQMPNQRKIGEDNYFSRGIPQRNTIGPIRTSQHSPQIRQQATPTIYEEPPQHNQEEVLLRHPERVKNTGDMNQKISSKGTKPQSYTDPVPNRALPAGDGGSKKSGSAKKGKKSSSDQQPPLPQQQSPYCPPIFKRGSLISNSTSSVDGVDNQGPPFQLTPKRVSFTSNYMEGQPEPVYWPTRNGPAPEPPTRQRKSRPDSLDSDVFLPNSPHNPRDEYSTYANVPATMAHHYQPPGYGVISPKLEAPNRPLPPVPREASHGVFSRKSRGDKDFSGFSSASHRWQQQSESESGSEAGEVQRILQQGSHSRGGTYFRFPEEEWGADGKARGPSGTDQSVSNVGRDDEVRRGGGGGGRSGRRDEPRRHTLSGDHHHHQQGGALARSMDLEMSSKSQRRKSPLPRGYPPPSSAMLFDEDPGIMSEVETSSTGFRRGGKQRSSLPVVRTPSKTLERPLGLVFLQYRSETKRALLPNEITSIDTVKALFVRSFPKQLTMEYLDSPHVKIYIHDSSKDMFYELEDLRSHLRDIRDRSVLRLFESTDMNGGVLPGAGVGVVAPPMWDQDQSYFSEPEFDSEYQHQHIHKTKASSKSGSGGGVPQQAPYYMTHSYPPGGSQGAPGASATLPRGGPLLRAYSPAVAPPVPADRIKTLPQTDRLHAESGYMSSPERGGPRAYPAAAYPPGGPGYEDPYYSQYASRSGSITPVIDEEASDTELIDESYSLYGVKLPTAGPGRSVVTPQPRSQFPAPAVVPYDATRIRVEHMERQLANLTGLVQKALTQTPTPREYLQVPPPASSRDANYRNGQ